jgi:Protein of unknown function (DUF4242)
MGDEPARAQSWATYLVEGYCPGLSVEELRRLASRVRGAAAEMEQAGMPLRLVGSTIVPTDESFLCTIEAASENLVREVYARAAIPFERISPVISDEEIVAGRDA